MVLLAHSKPAFLSSLVPLFVVFTDAYSLTSGTYRWMAPEVIRHESYSEKADVYSFAIVLWQLVTRDDPLADLSALQAAAAVALERIRPSWPHGTPPALMELVQACWHEDPDQRPSFDEICQERVALFDALSNEEEQWLEASLGHSLRHVHSDARTEVNHQAGHRRNSHLATSMDPPPPQQEQQRKRRGGGLRTLFARKSSPYL